MSSIKSGYSGYSSFSFSIAKVFRSDIILTYGISSAPWKRRALGDILIRNDAINPFDVEIHTK